MPELEAAVKELKRALLAGERFNALRAISSAAKALGRINDTLKEKDS